MTARLRQFLPLFDQNVARNDCRTISGWPEGVLVWVAMAVMVVAAAVGLWFITGLTAKRFLACAIDNPGEDWPTDEGDAMARLAGAIQPADIEPGRLHLLIGMSVSQLDSFKGALKGNPPIRSCVDRTINDGDRESAIWSKETILIMTDMHLALRADKQLSRLLAFLEERSERKLTTVVLSDVDTLDAITHPDHYADFSERSSSPNAEDVVRWIRLLDESVIHYLRVYRSSTYHDELARETQAFADLERLDAQIRPLWREGKLTEGEMVERVRRHAQGFYESLWRRCSNKERVILYRLAQGYLINPANAHHLVHLLEIGLLRRDPAIRLPNESIKRFILSAETPDRIEEWAGGSKASPWSIVRIPLLGLIFLLIVVVSSMGKETTDYVLGLLGAIAALLPLVVRVVGSMATAVKPSGGTPSSG